MEHVSLYGAIALSYILFKIVASYWYTPTTTAIADGGQDLDFGSVPTVSVIIPEYNENPDLFERGLQSLLGQDYPLEEIWIVDDGSPETEAWETAQEYAAEYDLVKAHRLPENRGKRHAQAYAFERASGELFVTMDSDTVLENDSVSELVKPFDDPDVTAVTGYPKVINKDTNLLTRFIDMRYWVAFNVERAARSVFGVVVCCCGVLSAYRRDVVLDSLEDYTSQSFFGSECTFGDDRHMTAQSLQRGNVEYQSTAQSYTDAPETVRKYLTQQTRWMRSFWRESLLALRWAPRRSFLLMVMLVIDLCLPFALVFFGFGSAVGTTLLRGGSIFAVYLLIVALVSYLRNLRYIHENVKVYALSPIYGVFYVSVLLPISFYALLTMTSNGWGTR